MDKSTEIDTSPILQLGSESAQGLSINTSSNGTAPTALGSIFAPAAASGIEILVRLAETGEIDPKNVDIIDVTDKFLRAIAAAPKENLRQSGKILFHASVLLRMKAEALLVISATELEAADDYLDFDAEGAPIIYDCQKEAAGRQLTLKDLERALVRRISKQGRQRKVTLEQLIDALKEAEKIEKTRGDRTPKARIELSGQPDVRDVDDILDLAHDEDIDSIIEKVERILLEALGPGDIIGLTRIIQLLSPHGDWLDAFLACLFLSNAGKIILEQQEFYGPLNLVRVDADIDKEVIGMEA